MPVNENTGAMTKFVTLSALQFVLQAHANSWRNLYRRNSCAFLQRVYFVDGKGYDKLQRVGTAAILSRDFEQPLVNETGAEQAVNSFEQN